VGFGAPWAWLVLFVRPKDARASGEVSTMVIASAVGAGEVGALLAFPGWDLLAFIAMSLVVFLRACLAA